MSLPLVSVLMPAYNAELYIAEAIESILTQSFINFEFIIIDDGSVDRTWEIIEEYTKKDRRIIPVRNVKNLGVSKTRNIGIKMSKGAYISLMDSDDISLSIRLEKQVKFLSENPEIGIVGGVMQIMDGDGNIYSERRYGLTDAEIRKKLFRYSPFSHPLVTIRKDILLKSGLYNEDINLGEDYDLYFRIGMYSKFANLSDILLNYRMSKNNSTTKKLKEMEMETLRIRRKAVTEYGYKMNIGDKIYSILQFISIYIIPTKGKIALFNFIRNQ